jgi:hypothetical protein
MSFSCAARGDFVSFTAGRRASLNTPVQMALPLRRVPRSSSSRQRCRVAQTISHGLQACRFDPTALELEVLGAIRSFGEDDCSRKTS